MNYCIVNDENIVTNIIVSDSSFAETIGALPAYDGAAIGEAYNPPPPPPTTEERLAALEAENKLLKEQVSAQADQAEFYEDCIAEMAAVVYA